MNSDASAATTSAKEQPSDARPANYDAGKTAYTANCGTCHMPNGQGVPGLNPPLQGTEYVKGDKTRLIKIVLHGLNEEIVIHGEVYANQMAGLGHLPDSTIANILTYVRYEFGGKATSILTEEIERVRG